MGSHSSSWSESLYVTCVDLLDAPSTVLACDPLGCTMNTVSPVFIHAHRNLLAVALLTCVIGATHTKIYRTGSIFMSTGDFF